MAHKKGQGSVRNGRDSNAQHRGLKVAGGTPVKKGVILIRQCGTRWRPGRNVGMGKDYTLYAETEGTVTFQANRRVHVDPVAKGASAAAAAASAPKT
jgi:large subunit ribosomal protein L27